MKEMYIVGKIKFDKNDGKGNTEWIIEEHAGLFKPKGIIRIHLDNQAGLDFRNHPLLEDWINNLGGRRIRIIID